MLDPVDSHRVSIDENIATCAIWQVRVRHEKYLYKEERRMRWVDLKIEKGKVRGREDGGCLCAGGRNRLVFTAAAVACIQFSAVIYGKP